MTLFEYLAIDMRFSKVFNDAMSNYSTIAMKKMLENYNGFDGLSTLVDVGGGTGQTLNMIIAKYPTIRGINFDLPHVIKDAPKYDGIKQLLVNLLSFANGKHSVSNVIYILLKILIRCGACNRRYVCECTRRGCYIYEGELQFNIYNCCILYSCMPLT